MRFTTSTLAILAAILSLTTPILALGINCEGSGNCALASGSAKKLTSYIDNIPKDRWYTNNENIACTALSQGSICAFLQGTGGALGRNNPGLAHFITDHGFDTCGGLPYFYPSDNNVADGQLRYNFVEGGACGEGLC